MKIIIQYLPVIEAGNKSLDTRPRVRIIISACGKQRIDWRGVNILIETSEVENRSGRVLAVKSFTAPC